MNFLYKTYQQVITENNKNGYIAYHGSNHEINRFTNNFISDENINASGPGIYTTNSIQDAMQWGDNIHKLILRPRKFISNEVPAEKVDRNMLMVFLNNVEDYSINRDPDIEIDKKMTIAEAIKYSKTEDEVFDSLRNEQYNYDLQGFMEAMIKIGYDMLKLKKDFTELTDVEVPYHYIVYNPDIISITGVKKISEYI